MELILELSGCHGGEEKNALQWIREAKKVGADAVKFQIFMPHRLADQRDKRFPRLAAKWGYQGLLDLYLKTHTPMEWFPSMIDLCKELQLPWFASVFSKEDADFALQLDIPRFKISSYEAPDYDLIAYCARHKKPMLISINQDSPRDVMMNAALVADAQYGNISGLALPTWVHDDLTILHATNYGVALPKANLWRILDFRNALRNDIKLGLSDHTHSHTAGSMAATMGIDVYERHMKLHNVPSPDDEFASYPEDIAGIFDAIRISERGDFRVNVPPVAGS